MADIDLKTETPDTTLPTTGFLFGADSQAASAPSVYSTQTVATTLLGSTSLTGETITTSQPVLNMSQTWNASGVTFTGLRFNAATGSSANSAAGSLLMDLQLEGSSQFRVGKSGALTIGQFVNISQTSNNLLFTLNGTQSLFVTNTEARLRSAQLLGFTSGVASDALDTFLSRRAAANLRLGAADAAAPVAQTLSVQSVVAGTSNTAGQNFTITGSQGTGTGAGGSIIFQVAPAGSSGTAQNALATAFQVNGNGGVTGQDGATANTLALRNGTNAQNFRVYNTTDGTNSEWLETLWSGNTMFIRTQKTGTGTERPISINAGAGNLTLNGSSINLNAGGSTVAFIASDGFPCGSDSAAYDLGRSSLRWRNLFLRGYSEFSEMTAPAAPAANGVRIYAEDNGSGKTRLMALFNTGAAQQIAIEP